MSDSAVTAIVAAVLVPFTVAIVAAITTAGLPTRFAPLAALTLGLVIGVGLALTGQVANAFDALVIGCGIGLSAVGAHAGTKAVFGLNPAPADPVTLPQPPPGPMPPAA